MILNLKKVPKLVKRNLDISFLFFLMIITIITTTFYNNNKKKINTNYKDTINNIYFIKTIDNIFGNLTPKYKSINHKISDGETFNKILTSYSITNNEIIKIKKELSSDYDLNNLKTNLDIKFTIDDSNNGKITSFIFPASRTKKIQLTRNLNTNLFEKK